MKTIIKNIVLCVILCTMVACDSWLDTTPPSQVPEEDQFDDEFGFRQALIGCYIGMDRFDVRKQIEKDLEAAGLLEKTAGSTRFTRRLTCMQWEPTSTRPSGH